LLKDILACFGSLGFVQDAVAVLVKFRDQLNSLGTTAAPSSAATASTATAGWFGGAPSSLGRFARSAAAPELTTGSLAFLIVEFTVLVFVESLENLFPQGLTVGAFPTSRRAVCRLSYCRLAKR